MSGEGLWKSAYSEWRWQFEIAIRGRISLKDWVNRPIHSYAIRYDCAKPWLAPHRR